MYDVKNLEKLSTFSKVVPKAMASFQAFDEAALADGAIPKNPFCGGLLTPMRYDLERGWWSRGGRLGARGSRRGPIQIQVLLFRFRGFSSVKDLGNDPR